MNSYSLYKRNNTYVIDYKNPATAERVRKSLKTSDSDLAELYAKKLWQEVLDDYDRGILVSNKDLSKIFKQYEEFETSKYNKETIKRHFVKYLDEKKIKVANIKQFTIDEYYKWRYAQTFKNKAPSDITVNRENCAIRSFLKFAVDHHYLTPKRELKLERKKVVPNRRRAFSKDEIQEILSKCREICENTKKRDLKATRECLYRIIKFLVATGMRDGSALGLMWKDLYLGETKPYMDMRADNNKTRKYAKISISSSLASELRAYKEMQIVFCKKHNIAFTENMKVFSVMHEYVMPLDNEPTGEIFPIKSFRKSWQTVIKQCSFYVEGEDYAPYRIRHYKITSLMSMKELSSDQIAKYCCTSPKMIANFYDATDTLDFYDDFANAENIVSQKANVIELAKYRAAL